jgi:ACR3 family arsenite transporter
MGAGRHYAQSATLSFTAAGNNFELAIRKGGGRLRPELRGCVCWVVGPLIEVPALIGLVNVAFWLRDRYFGLHAT